MKTAEDNVCGRSFNVFIFDVDRYWPTDKTMTAFNIYMEAIENIEKTLHWNLLLLMSFIKQEI